MANETSPLGIDETWSPTVSPTMASSFSPTVSPTLTVPAELWYKGSFFVYVCVGAAGFFFLLLMFVCFMMYCRRSKLETPPFMLDNQEYAKDMREWPSSGYAEPVSTTASGRNMSGAVDYSHAEEPDQHLSDEFSDEHQRQQQQQQHQRQQQQHQQHQEHQQHNDDDDDDEEEAFGFPTEEEETFGFPDDDGDEVFDNFNRINNNNTTTTTTNNNNNHTHVGNGRTGSNARKQSQHSGTSSLMYEPPDKAKLRYKSSLSTSERSLHDYEYDERARHAAASFGSPQRQQQSLNPKRSISPQADVFPSRVTNTNFGAKASPSYLASPTFDDGPPPPPPPRRRSSESSFGSPTGLKPTLETTEFQDDPQFTTSHVADTRMQARRLPAPPPSTAPSRLSAPPPRLSSPPPSRVYAVAASTNPAQRTVNELRQSQLQFELDAKQQRAANEMKHKQHQLELEAKKSTLLKQAVGANLRLMAQKENQSAVREEQRRRLLDQALNQNVNHVQVKRQSYFQEEAARRRAVADQPQYPAANNGFQSVQPPITNMAAAKPKPTKSQRMRLMQHTLDSNAKATHPPKPSNSEKMRLLHQALAQSSNSAAVVKENNFARVSAAEHTTNAVELLVKEIKRLGSQSHYNTNIVVTFGVLLNNTLGKFEHLPGLCATAKKQGIIFFEPDHLWPEKSDDVPITLYLDKSTDISRRQSSRQSQQQPQQ